MIVDQKILTSIVDLAGAGVNSLEQLVDLLIRHLLAEIRQDILDLADADKSSHVLVEDLESAAIFLRLARVAEAAGAVQDALERLKVNCAKRLALSQCRQIKGGCSSGTAASGKVLTVATHALLQVLNLSQSGILAAGSQEVA